MSLIRWEPFREMDNFFRRYAATTGHHWRENGGNWTPVANITETEKEYLIKAELPEVKKEDVKVSLENGILTISGERRQEKPENTENEIRVESFYGAFLRSFALPDNVDEQAVCAESKDGVLRVHIPKKEPARSKQVSIDVK